MAISKLDLTGGNTPFDPNDPRTFPDGFSSFEDSVQTEFDSGFTAANSAHAINSERGLPGATLLSDSGTLSVAPNRIYFMPFFAPFSWSASDIRFAVNVAAVGAGALARAGICKWSWANAAAFIGEPTDLVADMGTSLIDTTGIKTITSAVTAQQPGWYSVMLVGDESFTYFGPVYDSPMLGGLQGFFFSESQIRYFRFMSNDDTGTPVASGFSSTIPGETLNNSDGNRYPSPALLTWKAEV